MSSRTIQIKFDGSAAGFARAARHAERTLSDFERKAGKSAAGGMAKAGAKAGVSFMEQVSASLSKLGGRAFGLGGPLAVVAIPAAVGLGIAAGAAVAGGLLAAISGGVVAAGLAMAVKDPRVNRAVSGLGTEVRAVFMGSASAFVQPALAGVERVRTAIRQWTPDIRRTFASASRYVEPLVDGLLGMVNNVIPAIRRAVDRAAPVIAVIQRWTPKIGDAIGDAIDGISENSGNAAAGLEWLLMVVEGTIRAGGAFIGWLVDAFDWLIKVNDAAVSLAESMWGWNPLLKGQIEQGRETVDRLKATMEGAKTAGDQWKGGVQELTAAQQQQVAVWESAQQAHDLEVKAAGAGSAALSGYRDTVELTRLSLLGAIEKTGSFAAAMDALTSPAMNARAASRDYQAAIDAVKDSLKENGRTLDDNTAKGRANNTVLDNLATAAKNNASKIYEQTAATGNTTLAQKLATKAWNDGRASLVKAYLQFDNNIGRANAYADSVMGIPKNWTTTAKVDTGAATAKLASFIKKVRQADGTVANVTVRVTTKGDHYIPGVGTQLKDRWGGLHQFARGGMLGAHFASAPTVLYGERGTGGEAYIPRRGDMGRSRRIAETVVRDWLHGDVSWAGGRRTAPMPAGGRGGDTFLHNQVSLDGQPFYAYTSRAVTAERKRAQWRDRVGKR
ncbi:hypothetical protein [Micromonospora aurantiaca (nom. illeg.)]|uniref:hypothetical protein n=1 Tax=Micromonospora aurantiaca (nom. illeg.) TaxID=47850 RepID=UPI003F49FBF9